MEHPLESGMYIVALCDMDVISFSLHSDSSCNSLNVDTIRYRESNCDKGLITTCFNFHFTFQACDSPIPPTQHVCPDNSYQLDVQTGEFAYEMEWNVLNTGCNGTGYAKNDFAIYNTNCCLISGIYTLVCDDLYGDGFNGGKKFF